MCLLERWLPREEAPGERTQSIGAAPSLLLQKVVFRTLEAGRHPGGVVQRSDVGGDG
jgi:hypothetical protein